MRRATSASTSTGPNWPVFAWARRMSSIGSPTRRISRGTPAISGKCRFHSTRRSCGSIIATPSDMPSSVASSCAVLASACALASSSCELVVVSIARSKASEACRWRACAVLRNSMPAMTMINTEMQPANSFASRSHARDGASASSRSTPTTTARSRPGMRRKACARTTPSGDRPIQTASGDARSLSNISVPAIVSPGLPVAGPAMARNLPSFRPTSSMSGCAPRSVWCNKSVMALTRQSAATTANEPSAWRNGRAASMCHWCMMRSMVAGPIEAASASSGSLVRSLFCALAWRWASPKYARSWTSVPTASGMVDCTTMPWLSASSSSRLMPDSATVRSRQAERSNFAGSAAHPPARMRSVWSSSRICRWICSWKLLAWLLTRATTRAVASRRCAVTAVSVPIQVIATRTSAGNRMAAARNIVSARLSVSVRWAAMGMGWCPSYA